MTFSVRFCASARLLAGVFVSALLLGGCANLLFPQSAALREAPLAGVPERIELARVPFFAQDDYQCGPAALATLLVYSGRAVTPQDLVSQVYVPARKGSLQVEMLAAARRQGSIAFTLAPRLEDLLREIAAGNPVVVLQDLGVWPFERWHYAVAVGYDLGAEELILRSGENRRLVLPFAVHEFAWRKGGYWAMLALPPERIAASASEARWLAAVTALESTGNWPAAAAGYTAALARWPASAAAAIGLANTHYAQGNLAEVESVLRTLLERSPHDVVARNNLAQTLSDLGRNREALEEIERAAMAPGQFEAAVRETRSQILRRLAEGKQ